MMQPLDILKAQPRRELTETDRMYGATWKVQCPACHAEVHHCRFRFDNGRELFDSMEMHAAECRNLHAYAIEQHLSQVTAVSR